MGHALLVQVAQPRLDLGVQEAGAAPREYARRQSKKATAGAIGPSALAGRQVKGVAVTTDAGGRGHGLLRLGLCDVHWLA